MKTALASLNNVVEDVNISSASISHYTRNVWGPVIALVHRNLETGLLFRVPKLSYADGETVLDLDFDKRIPTKVIANNLYEYAKNFVPEFKKKKNNHDKPIYSFISDQDKMLYLYLYNHPRMAENAHKFSVHSNFVHSRDVFLGYAGSLGLNVVKINDRPVETKTVLRRLSRIKR